MILHIMELLDLMGTTAKYEWTPYRDHPATWKQVFYDDSSTLYSFPNQEHRMGIFEEGVTGFGQSIAQITVQETTRNHDSLVLPPGSWADRTGYLSDRLMGHILQTYAMVIKIKFDSEYPLLNTAFLRMSNEGIYGLKYNDAGDELPRNVPLVEIVNEHLPYIAGDANEYMVSQGSGDNGVDNQMYRLAPMSLIWYHDDWQEIYCGGINICADYEHNNTCRESDGTDLCDVGDCEWKGDECGNYCGADSDCDGCVDDTELFNSIQLWKQGTVEMNELIDAIVAWKEGC
jgi:hypothetical protein